jgi:uracil-DNA glycosylase
MGDDQSLLLDQQIRSCRRCVDILARSPTNPPSDMSPTEPRPIASAVDHRPVMLIGQAPGLTEYRTGMPFQGGAGQQIRAIFCRSGSR